MARTTAVYINLPVKDLARSRRFWEALGFSFNEEFSDDRALQLVLDEGKINAMLLSRAFFQTFTDRPVANGATTQVLIALEVESREQVDELVSRALAHGGSRYSEPKDHDWMYYDTFADPDGHQWEVLYSDESKLS
jgi:predicted lactoylglutathione lyase